MTPEEEKYFQLQQEKLTEEQLQRMQYQNALSTNNLQRPDSKDLAMQQLDLKSHIDLLFHLLSSHVIERDTQGNEVWTEPKDDRLKILSDYGARMIMKYTMFYLNINLLMSNYKEEQIPAKCLNFGIELSDLIYNSYEHFFYYPKTEDLFYKLIKIVIDRNMDIAPEELYFKCEKWSQEELQSKLRHYPMLVLAVTDSVHATFLRALNGKERESLRKQMNIYQNMSVPIGGEDNKQKFSLVKPSTWK